MLRSVGLRRNGSKKLSRRHQTAQFSVKTASLPQNYHFLENLCKLLNNNKLIYYFLNFPFSLAETEKLFFSMQIAEFK